MNSPRVLRLSPEFDWPGAGAGTAPHGFNAVGGLQRQILRQVRALSALGVQQTILALPMPGADERFELDARTTVQGVGGPFVRAALRSPGAIRLHLAWAAGVRRHLRFNPQAWDLIHVHSTCVPWPLVAALSSEQTLDIPLVVSVHCSMLATYRPVSRRDAAVQALARRIERRAVRRASFTTVLTERTRARLIEVAGIGEQRVVVVPDCLDVERFRASGTAASARAFAAAHGVPANGPILLYLARVSHEKGWPVLLELARALPAGHILVCGGGPEEGALRASIAAAGLEGRFTLTGFVDEDQAAAALALADLLVMPSNFEELGSAAVEATALGVPVVAFDAGGPAEALDYGKAGIIVPPGDVAGFIAATQRLLEDPALARRLAEHGASVAQERFDIEPCSRRIYELYESVLAERDSGSGPGTFSRRRMSKAKSR